MNISGKAYLANANHGLEAAVKIAVADELRAWAASIEQHETTTPEEIARFLRGAAQNLEEGK